MFSNYTVETTFAMERQAWIHTGFQRFTEIGQNFHNNNNNNKKRYVILCIFNKGKL